jgi:glucose-6-phosphate isomerase
MHDLFMSNLFAQSSALAFGKTAEEIAAEGTPADVVPHKVMPGNRPSSTILARRLTPSVLGQLIAFYEHVTFVQGTVWGIDSFDQWGVELGKATAMELVRCVRGEGPEAAGDPSTAALVRRYRALTGRWTHDGPAPCGGRAVVRGGPSGRNPRGWPPPALTLRRGSSRRRRRRRRPPPASW